MLPEEADYIHETDNLKFTSRRTTPSRLGGSEHTLPNSACSILLPESVLEFSSLSSSNVRTFIDARFSEYGAIEGPQGTESSVVDYRLLEIGYYENTSIEYYTTPIDLEISGLNDWIIITIAITNIHAEFAPTCVYASAIDEVAGVTTWSASGCELQEVRRIEGTVICRCNHASRFTAGENLIELEV